MKNNKLELAVNIFCSFEQKNIHFQLQAVDVQGRHNTWF